MLGYVENEAARWLNPLLSCDMVTMRYLSSSVYKFQEGASHVGHFQFITLSFQLCGVWRYCVVDLHVFVNGSSNLLPQLQEILERGKADLHGLTVRNICSRISTFMKTRTPQSAQTLLHPTLSLQATLYWMPFSFLPSNI